MGFVQNIIARAADRITDRILDQAGLVVATARDYRRGIQPKQLKVKPLQYDDNVTLNFSGLAVARAVAQLVGRGVGFDFEGDTETPQEQFVNATWKANKMRILLIRMAIAAAEAGTGYLSIYPDGVIGDDGKRYPRLVLEDPAFVTMETAPEDFEMIIRYTIQYKFVQDGKEKARKRVIENEPKEDGAEAWRVRDFISDDGNGSRWIPVSDEIWPYPFCPIIHWQNWPTVDSPYGESDLDDPTKQLQNHINLNGSNNSKIIRLYAHPKTWARHLGQTDKVQVGPDEIVNFNSNDGGLFQLEPLGDLKSSLDHLKMLRQTLFATRRVVDLDSLTDKLGSLTNFGLRVLYQDNLSMIATKQALLGDCLEEINRRIQIMAGMEAVPCECVWPDFLPVNETEQAAGEIQLVAAGLKSKQSAATDIGEDWEQEQERLAEEQAAQTNIGAELLRGFENGAGGF